MRVRCIQQLHDEAVYSDLTVGNVYRVVGTDGEFFRIISDEGRPYLFPAAELEVVDAAEDEDWVTTYDEDGERCSYPRELSAPGFFEDYFDDVPGAHIAFRAYATRVFRGSSD